MLNIVNPKQHLDSVAAKESRVFPYYAGFSIGFAENVLSQLSLSPEAVVLDPWNGSGTTGIAAYKNNLNFKGRDLNPAMALVAKAAFISSLEVSSLLPLSHSLIEAAIKSPDDGLRGRLEPLEKWFYPSTAFVVRSIERQLNKFFVSEAGYQKLDSPNIVRCVSPTAAFFYVALFRVVRRLISDFIGSNPTWIKAPKTLQGRKKTSGDTVRKLFVFEVEMLAAKTNFFYQPSSELNIDMSVANARSLDVEDSSIDAILTSPPYCTRIDYAVATSIELAVLRIGGSDFDFLRRAMTGTSTVEKTVPALDQRWGGTCLNFLEKLYKHDSYASSTYYYKNHVQYYAALYESLSEISRVAKPGAHAILVVQSSYYKDLQNDVATVMVEMGQGLHFGLSNAYDFVNDRSMADLNKNSRMYNKGARTIETVLHMEKLG